MACMEHVCKECDCTWFDNEPQPSCPKCGSSEVSHFFDEQPDPPDEEEEELEDEWNDDIYEDDCYEDSDSDYN